MSATASGASSLRAEPAFVRWAAAEGVSMIGTAVSTVVLPIIVYEATGSAAQTGILFALRVVPYLLVGLVAGPIADRGNRRLLIIGGNVGEGLLVATIPIAAALGVLTVAQVYVVALASATVFVFSDAAVFGAVPALVGPQRLPPPTACCRRWPRRPRSSGPAIGGVLAVADRAARRRSASTPSASSSRRASSRRSPVRSATGASPGPPADPPADRTALSFIRRQRTVAVLLGVGFGNSFAFGAVLGLLVPYGVEQLDIPSDDVRIGLLYASRQVGAVQHDVGAELAAIGDLDERREARHHDRHRDAEQAAVVGDALRVVAGGGRDHAALALLSAAAAAARCARRAP